MEKGKVINALVTCYKLTMERRTGREVQIVVEKGISGNEPDCRHLYSGASGGKRD